MGRRILRKAAAVPQEEPSVNLTPLIDVVFVVLIMFILIAPLLEIDKIDLAAASNNPKGREVKDASEIAIRVAGDNSIMFNGEPVGILRLQELLTAAKRRYPGAHPQVFHDRRAEFGTYQSIKNAVEAAGFEEMDVVLKPQ